MLKRFWLASICTAAFCWTPAATRAEFPVEWTQCFSPRKQTTPACSLPWGYYQTTWRPWNAADADYHPQAYNSRLETGWGPGPSTPYVDPTPAGPMPRSYPPAPYGVPPTQPVSPPQATQRMNPPMSGGMWQPQQLPPTVRNFPISGEMSEISQNRRPLPPHLTGEDRPEPSPFRTLRAARPIASEETTRPDVMSVGGHTLESGPGVDPPITNPGLHAPRATREEDSYPSAPNPRRSSFGHSEHVDAAPQTIAAPTEEAPTVERQPDPVPDVPAAPAITPQTRSRGLTPLPIITPARPKTARPRVTQERAVARPSATTAEPEIWPPRTTKTRSTTPANSSEIWPPSAIDFRR